MNYNNVTKNEWEWVAWDTHRLKVDGGYIYEVEHERFNANGPPQHLMSTVFVPDAANPCTCKKFWHSPECPSWSNETKVGAVNEP